MKHPDWLAFLAAIVAEPEDNALRLVAADFLEENGDPSRAEFIRVQVALSGGPGLYDWAELARRERAFLDPLSAHAPVWAAEECAELVRGAPVGASIGWCGAADSWSACIARRWSGCNTAPRSAVGTR